MEGSTGYERILVRSAVVIGAINVIEKGPNWVKVNGVHLTLQEVFTDRGVKATIPWFDGEDKPLLKGQEDPHVSLMRESDLIVIEGSYIEPRLTARIEAAKKTGKPIMFLREESSKIQSRVMFDDAFRWVNEYRNYIVLRRWLNSWFDANVRAP